MENRGEGVGMRNRTLVLLMFVLISCIGRVYGDNADSGWKGYGLYNLSKSGITVVNESDTVKISGADVEAVYEYTIKNDSNRDIVASLGIPNNDISKFSIHDGSKYLRYWKTNAGYVKDNYGLEDLQNYKNGWYIFNMVFAPEQARTIKVSIEAEMKKAENDTYSVGIFKDRSYPYTALSQKVSYRLNFEDFRPYNVVSIEGLQPEQVSYESGEINLSYEGNYGGGALITYQPVDKMTVDKLGASAYKKPKAIAKAFLGGNYQDAITYCDEYMESPSDKNLSIEQVKFIKAESLRLSGKKQEYLEALNDIDTAKLYPGRIRYKLLLDRLETYDSLNNSEEMNKILEELIPETKGSYPYLFYWLDSNGYKLQEEQVDPGLVTYAEKTAGAKSKGSFNIPEIALKLLESIGKSRITYIVVGFAAGFVVGRLTKRRRRRRSVYMFRN